MRIAGVIAGVIFSIVILTSPSEPLPLPPPNVTQSSTDAVEVIATGLERPGYMAFADERIFVTEKEGRVRVIQDGTLLERPLASVRTAEAFNGGLLGIATHPNFSNNHFLYIYYTYEEEGELWNKVMRIQERDNRLVDAVTILDGVPGSRFSNGGSLEFGPDGKLYVTTGSVSDSLHLSQDPGSLAGKILRINDDGTIPDDNPYPGSPVYSIGHRNPQGLAWDGDAMYSTDLGPSKNDEINMIIPGSNYGWPVEACSGPLHEEPLACFDPAIEPGGILVYSGIIPELEGKLVVSSLRASSIFTFDPDEDEIGQRSSILGGLGRIRDVGQGPDGLLYALTSNTDGKGFPDQYDDKLIRIKR